MPHALIVGAGLAGSLLGCYLARAGWRVSIYERRPDPRAHGYAGGRSINLALSVRGLSGLAGAGLAEMVMQTEAIPMRGRAIHPVTLAPGGTPLFQPYSHDPHDAINSVSRGGLNLALLRAAAEAGIELHFEHACVDVDLDAPAAVFEGPNGRVQASADLILGADGAYSPVRARLQRTDRFDYSQSYLAHGYKELSIPAGPAGFQLEPHALHIWPRGSSMMIALPNRDHSFTCTLFWPLEGDHSFASLRSAEDVRAHFATHYPDAVPLLPTLVEDYFANPTGSLVTVRCAPWRWQDKVAILGDAAHAIVPFYGQGMNAAFEDCKALAECLAAHGSDREAALAEFEARRRPNANAIADMALANFVEMRDKVGNAEFLYRKRVEQTVHQAFPERVTPQYNLVSFSTVPYVEAFARGQALDRVLDQVIAAVPMSRLSALGETAWKEAICQRAAAVLDGAVGAPAAGELIDLTPAITPQLGVWPGDTPLAREVLCDLARGDNITLSTLRATAHLGAHADGPNHYGVDAPGIGERPLEPYVGPCHVIDAPVARGTRVQLADLRLPPEQIRHPRVLLRTGTFPDPHAWNEDFAGLSVELVETLAARGVRLIGLDTPSVDLFTSKDLPAHQAFLRHDVAILEGLVLRDVEPGEYELLAAPLKLVGFDASPVRAVLRRR
ncbi:MAG: FAD-dependent monooxygenase [Verrucomicrobia bacterium]|nr:FAD-dependent monooxygenase [Verrucomicrobiota bacterium]